MYNKDTLKIWPLHNTRLLESWTIRGKYINWFANYKLEEPDEDWWHPVTWVLVRTWFNLKTYIQPPYDGSILDDDDIPSYVKSLYQSKKEWSTELTMSNWNHMYKELRVEVLSHHDIEYDESLIRN